MRIVSFFLAISILSGMQSCRESPARGNSRKVIRDIRGESINHKEYYLEKGQKQYSNDGLELPLYIVTEKNILLKRKRYTVLYNVENKIPDWVAWQLTSEQSIGSSRRLNIYFEDLSVPSPRAIENDYKGAVWTHGHMCPAGDNKWDEVAMRESNLLTNICPQDKSLNSGLWNKIEQDCRRWAKKYGEVYIVCGPVLLNREHETIGKNNIVVPEAFFKVVLRMNSQPSAIGFVVRNNVGKKKRDQYVNSVDDVERITGIDFFPALPDSIEDKVEAYANLEDWK